MKAVGVHLEGEQPTEAERQELERMAEEAGLTKYRVRRTVAWNAYEQKRIVRLDALEIK